MRFIYTMAWWLSLPLILARLWWRGRKEPGYRLHVAERLGWYAAANADATASPVIWVHAVSVGETRAAEPLIDALLAAYPSCRVLLTHMTPTGRATGKDLFGHQVRVQQCYLPYDIGWMIDRFLAHFQPRLCLLMETEIWPNLMARCASHRLPVALVNARLSARSLARAMRLSALMRPAARALTCVGAQTEADAVRLKQAGAAHVTVTGSIKFDVTPSPAMLEQGRKLRQHIGPRPVLLCASTRAGEEEMILDAFAGSSLPAGLQDLLLVLVPRHPQRFDEVAGLIRARNLSLQRRSALPVQGGDQQLQHMAGAQVLLGDTMGEMFAYYVACDLAFIGGSLLPLGGQNLIEACAVGKPVLAGPHTFNFEAVTQDAIAAGAAVRVRDAQDLMEQAITLLQQAPSCQAMGGKAQAFARQHRGATLRTMQLVQSLLPASV